MGLITRTRDAVQAWRHGRVIEMQVPAGQDTLVMGLPAERWDPYSWNTTMGLRTIDDLVQTKGIGIYREMMHKDPHVSSCVYLPIMARLSSGWDFVPASDEPEDARVAEFVRFALDKMVSRLLTDAMEALPIGFSCIERIWGEPYTTGEWSGFQGYRAFRPLPQETVTYKRDEHGDMEPDGVWQAKSDHPGSMVTPGLDPAFFTKMPADRFIRWYWRSEYGNPLGLSILRPAYAPYFFKQLVVKQWARYMSKHGLSGVRVRVPANATKKQMDDAVEYARRYQTDLVMAYRDGTDIVIDSPNTAATMNYEAGITSANKEIAHACLQPSTLLDVTDQGSYALAKEQSGTFTWFLDNVGGLLSEEVMQQQVIRPLVTANFGPQYECPWFTFRGFSQPDRESIARMIDLLVRAGMDVPKSWIRETLGVPEVSDEQDRLNPPAVAAPMPPATVAMSGDADLDALLQEFTAARWTGDRDRGCAALRGIR
jgi:phage gp29-like protein